MGGRKLTVAAFLCFEVLVPQGSWKIKTISRSLAFRLSKQKKDNSNNNNNNINTPNKQTKTRPASLLHSHLLEVQHYEVKVAEWSVASVSGLLVCFSWPTHYFLFSANI